MSVSQNFHLNQASAMPPDGGGQINRIGDRINSVGFKIRMLLGQKGDRPNVHWRYVVHTIPKTSSTAYGDVFKNITGNVLLDEANRDRVKVITTGVWWPNQGGLSTTGQDEYTFVKSMYIPHIWMLLSVILEPNAS